METNPEFDRVLWLAKDVGIDIETEELKEDVDKTYIVTTTPWSNVCPLETIHCLI